MKTYNVTRLLSQNPMLIYSEELNIKKNNTNETLCILNKHIIKENYQNWLGYITDKKRKTSIKSSNNC